MKFPRFSPGDVVCFLAKKENKPAICSGTVSSLLYESSTWKYSLTEYSTEFVENKLMNFTEAFGEYYEQTRISENRQE